MNGKIISLTISLLLLVILINSCSSIEKNISKKDSIETTTIAGEDIELRNELRHQDRQINRQRDRNNRHRNRSSNVSFEENK